MGKKLQIMAKNGHVPSLCSNDEDDSTVSMTSDQKDSFVGYLLVKSFSCFLEITRTSRKLTQSSRNSIFRFLTFLYNFCKGFDYFCVTKA